MRTLIKLTTASALVLALFSAVIGLAPTSNAGSYVTTDEARVLSLVNKTRTSKGLKPLARNDALTKMAREQSDRMVIKGNIYHNPSLGGDIAKSGLEWLRVGENVGMGPNVDLIEDAFLKSPKHYENIIYPDYNTAGIGVVRVSAIRVYVTQVFANVKGGTSASSKSKPAPATPKVTAPLAPAADPVAPPSAPAAAAPAPAPATPQPTVRPPSVLPNAVVGGLVNDQVTFGA